MLYASRVRQMSGNLFWFYSTVLHSCPHDLVGQWDYHISLDKYQNFNLNKVGLSFTRFLDYQKYRQDSMKKHAA